MASQRSVLEADGLHGGASKRVLGIEIIFFESVGYPVLMASLWGDSLG